MSKPKWLSLTFYGCNSMKLNYNIFWCSLNSWAALWVKQLEEYCLYHTLTEMHNRKLGCQVCEGIRNKQWLEQLEQKRAHTHTPSRQTVQPCQRYISRPPRPNSFIKVRGLLSRTVSPLRGGYHNVGHTQPTSSHYSRWHCSNHRPVRTQDK